MGDDNDLIGEDERCEECGEFWDDDTAHCTECGKCITGKCPNDWTE